MNASIRILVAIAMATLLCTMAWAQGETGQITGVVTDPSGAVIPNAKIAARLQTTGAERAGQTTESGMFTLTNLVPGTYTVSVSASGFATSQRQIALSPGARAGADFKLEVGRSETVVQVTESAGTVNTETQTVGAVITGTQVLELPSLTRNIYDFIAIAGNVSSTSDMEGGATRGVGYAINGQRDSSVNIMLDGASNNDDFRASVGMRVPLDAVGEYSVVTSAFTAEIGRAGGGVVNVVTKQGTNALHGSAYLFNRVSKLASNGFNNNANELDKEHFTRNQFGYSIGGPIKKDKLFFFQNTEWTRIRSMANTIAWAPTPQFIAAAAANTRNFFSTFGEIRSNAQVIGSYTRTQMTAMGFDPCTGASATGPCVALAASTPFFTKYQYTVPYDAGAGSPQNTYQLVGRIDYNLNSKTQIYGRYALENESDLTGTVDNSVYSGFDVPNTNVNNAFTMSIIRTVSPTVVSQSRLSFNRFNNQQPLGERPPTPTLFFRTAASTILGEYVMLPGYLPTSPGSAIPFGGPQNQFTAAQDLSVIRGRHQIRVGGQYTYMQDNRTFGAYMNPVQTLGSNWGTGIDNFLKGSLYQFGTAIDPQGKYPCNGPVTPQCSVNLPVGFPNFSRSNRYHEMAFYGQDSWRVSRGLTLNLGLRWEYFGIQHNTDPRLDSNFYDGSGGSVFERIRNGTVTIAPNSAIGGLWRKDWNNFAPRLGFAWDVFGNGKTSFRGGYGIGYERNFGNVTFNAIQNPPNYAVIQLQSNIDVPFTIPVSTDLAGPLAGTSGSKGIPAVSLRNIDMNMVTAYAHSWSAALEHQIAGGVLVAAEYTGSKGSKLYSIENPNMIGAGNLYLGDPCTIGDTSSCRSRLLLNKGFTSINRRSNGGFSHYNGLNLKAVFTNLASAGVNLSVNYTWSHAIDNLSTTFSETKAAYNLGLLDPFNPSVDKGNAEFDLRHRLSIGGTWDIPFAKNTTGVARHILHGWAIVPIMTASTGNPYSLFDFTNNVNAVAPRAFFDAPVPIGGPTTLVAGDSPNVLHWLQFTDPAYKINHDYVNPITGSSEFGPFPSNMTGRNVFYGPGSFNLDLGIYKNFSISEKMKAQLRFESYNALNHANLLVDGGTFDTSGGDYVDANYTGKRNIQLAFKITF
jgi:hypothetical protein